MSKKARLRLGLAGGVLLVLILLIVIVFSSKPVIASPYTVSDDISSSEDICVTSIYYNGQDLTGEIDHQQLIDLLSQYRCRLTILENPSHLTENRWLIDLIHGGKPIHVVVGEDEGPYCYSNTLFNYWLLDAQSLWQEIHDLT